MDPVTAIGLASGILTFIDFAHKIATGADELYQKATTDENMHTEKIVNDLDDAATDLASLPGRTKHEKALNRLSESCREVSHELQQLLRRLTVSGKRTSWKALKITVRNVRKESELAKLLARLDKYRGELLLRLNLMLNDQQCSIKQQLDRIETEGLNFSKESATQLKKLRKDILQNMRQLSEERSGIGNRINSDPLPVGGISDMRQSLNALSLMMTTIPKENIILQSLYFPSLNTRETTIDNAEDGTFEWIFDEETKSATDGGDESASDTDNQDDNVSTDIHNTQSEAAGEDIAPTVASEVSSHISTRSSTSNSSNSISKSDYLHGTYAELRKRDIRQRELRARATARGNFISWLSSGQGIFHITGKLGSGKSTLMKFLCSHPRTLGELRSWAGESKKLVFARFYFWKSSNDKMQMSLPGLYRSILFETLKHYPNLIPELFRKQWDILSNGIPHTVENLVTDIDTHQAFEALTTKGAFPNHRFCFFVDGLDEYQGEISQQLKLTRDLQRWARGNDIKICASSRPYIQFDKLVTSDDQIIRLHELTRHDIFLFSHKMIHDNLEEMHDHHLRLIDEVVDKSDGVFLWARLVVCSLLEGMIRHDNEETLTQKLNIIPSDIDDLYVGLLSSLSSGDRLRAERMLLFTAHAPRVPVLGSVVYTFLDEVTNAAFPPLDGKRPPTWRTFQETARIARLQLKSLTKGLLELRPLPVDPTNPNLIKERQQVQFIHRTVRDFVHERYSWDTTLARFPWITKPETYYRLHLAELILLGPSLRGNAWNYGWIVPLWRMQTYATTLSADLLEGFERTLLECKGSPSLTEDYIPQGYYQVFSVFFIGKSLSFVHLAGYLGWTEYVKRKIARSPEFSTCYNGYHILLSAAIGENTDLVRWLLNNGSCATDSIDWEDRMLQAREHRRVPLWCVFIVYTMYHYLWTLDRSSKLWEILELLLRDPHIIVGDPLMIARHWKDKDEHCVTLRQVIELIRPPNADRLLARLGQSSRKIFTAGTRRFLSRFIPIMEQTDTTREKIRHRLTRAVVNDYFHFRYQKAIFGDLVLEDRLFKLY